jgi:hypothetical protein
MPLHLEHIQAQGRIATPRAAVTYYLTNSYSFTTKYIYALLGTNAYDTNIATFASMSAAVVADPI